MTYTICPKCGQKVLPVATRCPGCGVPFEAQFYQHPTTAPGRKKVPRSLIIAGVVATVVVANAVLQLRKTTPPPAPPAAVMVTAAPAEPEPMAPSESTVAVAESLGTGLSPLSGPPSESLPSGAGVEAPAPSVTVTVDTVGAIAVGRRYASTWMNVRAGRSGTAPVLRILRPGEVVQVDSLQQGWYRLVSEQQPAGYADHRLLDSVPPAVSP